MLRIALLSTLCCCAALFSGCGSQDASQAKKTPPRVKHTGNVLTESMGVETIGGTFTPIVKKGTQIPATFKEVFSTAADNQLAVDIHVMAGNGQTAKDNRSVGRFQLYGIPTAPRGVPQIEVAFIIDGDGVLTVKAKDMATGKENEVRILGVPAQAKEQ